MIISLDHKDQPTAVSQGGPCAGKSWILTLEVTRQCQCQRDAVAVDLALNAPPRGNEHDCLGGIAAGGLQDTIEVLPCVLRATSVVGIVLPSDLDAETLQDLFQLIIDLVVVLVSQRLHLVPVSPENVPLAASKVGMHLTGQQRVFRDVVLSAVVVEGQKEEPDGTDEDQEE